MSLRPAEAVALVVAAPVAVAGRTIVVAVILVI